ncbi:AraC family transcriptional regulator [Arenibaculum sp.]|jgi:AraC-like DNA-binding protein|uniref:AraC family transcriptional regulator n=1 Tax=Arenibaculum sp. TaxID=2865862 RepID=UPI002E0D37EC|nr:AraC family transcriptional regulator [Arenibaculum sp.]
MPDAVLFHSRYDHEFMAHSHDVLTFILVTGGTVRIDIDGTSYRVDKGQFVTIGAHQVHAARPVDGAGWKMRSVHLRPETLAGFSRMSPADIEGMQFLRPVHDAGNPAGSLFLDIHYRSEVDGPNGERGDRFRSFLGWLSNNLDMLAPQPRSRRSSDDRAEQARKILADTIFDGISLDQVANEVGMSPFALIRSFKKNFGICPHTWRLQQRANEVARLLRSRVRLIDAAGACGFSDQSHMARVFKKVFGVTPGQYGSMHRADRLQ